MSEKLCVVRNSPIHGSGVFAVKPIKKGTRIIEYKGKRLTHKEADRIYGGTSETGHTFLFTLNDYYVIDANKSGNAARWINHGCAPNCTSICEEADDGKPEHERVFIASRVERLGLVHDGTLEPVGDEAAAAASVSALSLGARRQCLVALGMDCMPLAAHELAFPQVEGEREAALVAGHEAAECVAVAQRDLERRR